MMYSYLRNNAEWLLQQLGVSDIESSEFQPLPGQSVTEEKPTLLTMMFHIGHQPFDQVYIYTFQGLGFLCLSHQQISIYYSCSPARCALTTTNGCALQCH